MKKLFYLTNICNLFLGILLFISTYIIYEVNINTILLFIGVIIFEIAMFIVYIKSEKEVKVIDYLINSCYFIFVIFYLLFILYYQYNNIIYVRTCAPHYTQKQKPKGAFL